MKKKQARANLWLEGLGLLAWAVCLLGLVMAMAGCTGDNDSSKTVVTGLVATDADGTMALATVTKGDTDIEDAQITVNDVPLTFGLPLDFTTDGGLHVNIVLPLYFANLSGVNAGQVVDFLARSAFGTTLYERKGTIVPQRAMILSPLAGAEIPVYEDFVVGWRSATDAQAYAAGYSEEGAFDLFPARDDDVGFYADLVDSSTSEVTVPSAYTLNGPALAWVEALAGDVDILAAGNDEDSLFLASHNDDVEITITPDVPAEDDGSPQASQGLRVVKNYDKEEKGLIFKMRECDPNQIQAPGTINLKFRMRRFKVSVAFFTAYDMEGKVYYSGKKERIMKSSKSTWRPSFTAKPGTTVVFGTHDASCRDGTYSY
jgi:hypothetical protein